MRDKEKTQIELLLKVLTNMQDVQMKFYEFERKQIEFNKKIVEIIKRLMKK